jgi:hypothetical protein
VRLLLRRIFSGWYLDERAWVAGTLALWILTYLVVALVTMIARRRAMSPRVFGRQLGPVWKLTFVAAVLWLVGWSVWLTVESAVD